MLNETVKFEQISRVLEVFFNDPEFVPIYERNTTEENPTRDKIKMKILRIESAWDFRNRVIKCLRHQEGLDLCERLWKRRFMTKPEHRAFWDYWFHKKETMLIDPAIRKIHLNMERAGVFFAE